MKIKALARSVMRYFGPAATSVSPKIDPLPGGVTMTIDPRTFPINRPWVPPRTERTERTVRATSIKPPGNEMPWGDWRKLAAELDAPPGWAACRFPTWYPDPDPTR